MAEGGASGGNDEEQQDEAIEIEADIICAAIVMEAFEEGMDTMLGMCANNGQATLIERVEPDYEVAAAAAFEGVSIDISSDHDEAVGIIIEVGNEIMSAAAAACAEVRAAAEALKSAEPGE